MIGITKHFSKRYRERVAHSKRIKLFANRAYHYGYKTEELDRDSLWAKLTDKELLGCSEARVYKGFVYWFGDGAAITIYPLEGKMRQKYSSF